MDGYLSVVDLVNGFIYEIMRATESFGDRRIGRRPRQTYVFAPPLPISSLNWDDTRDRPVCPRAVWNMLHEFQ